MTTAAVIDERITAGQRRSARRGDYLYEKQLRGREPGEIRVAVGQLPGQFIYWRLFDIVNLSITRQYTLWNEEAAAALEVILKEEELAGRGVQAAGSRGNVRA